MENKNANERRIIVFIAAVIVCVFLFYFLGRFGKREGPSDLPEREYNNEVARVISADTLVLNNGEIIRLAGIECPKKKRQLLWWQYGFEFEKIKHLEPEATVTVENILDISNGIRIEKALRRKDSEGRRFVYLFVRTYRLDKRQFRDEEVFHITKDAYEIFLNGYLVRMGYAKTWDHSREDDNYMADLKALERRAERDYMGIWQGRK